jgi:hypothetical protein
MLSPLDDTLWHQLPTTFDHVGTSDPRFFDRYWFALTEPGGAASAQLTLGVYNNMNVVDCGAVAVRGTQQFNLRASRSLRPRFEAAVGPMRVDVLEPLARHRIRIDAALRAKPEPRFACDLEWRAILPAEEERPHFRRERGRAVEDYQRFDQVGEVSGWLEIGDEKLEVNRWWSCRDHSWGLRQGIGIPEPVTGAQTAPSDAGSLFCFLFFSTAAWAGHVQIMERGAQRIYMTGLLRPRDGSGRDRHVREAELRFDLYPNTRRFRNATLALRLDSGDGLEVRAEPLCCSIAMPGLGYGGWNDGLGLGVWRGDAHEEGEIWDVADPAVVIREDGRRETPVHRIAPVRVECSSRSGDRGTGSLTFIAMGRLPQYGLGA